MSEKVKIIGHAALFFTCGFGIETDPELQNVNVTVTPVRGNQSVFMLSNTHDITGMHEPLKKLVLETILRQLTTGSHNDIKDEAMEVNMLPPEGKPS